MKPYIETFFSSFSLPVRSFYFNFSGDLPRTILLGCFLVIGSGCSQSPKTTWTINTEARFRVGDDARWAQPEWDDSAWKSSPIIELPNATGPLWVRLDIPVTPVETLGLDIAGLAAREVYWDGILVGKSGRIGTDYNSEKPGPIDTVFRIPDSLAAPGVHIAAIRISTFKRPTNTSGLRMEFVAGDYSALKTAPLRAIGVPLLFLGGFVLVALYYGVLYFADNRRLPYLLTAALCLSVAALLIAEGWRNAFGYTYDYHAIRVAIIEVLTAVVGVLLSAAFAIQFDLPRRRMIISILSVIVGMTLVLIQDHETSAYAVFTGSLIVALGIAGWAAWHRKSGAVLALAGVAICFGVLLITGFNFMDKAFFPSFGVLVAGLLTSVGLKSRQDRQRHALTLATAARLEAELLKKHLQPHFLMNTLTSMLELVETDPARGAKAIEALATELRSLTDVSGERLISMAKELELCRAQLKVLGFRHTIQFELDSDGVNLDGTVPPAIIHTLIENAVTHNAYPPGNVTFTLREAQQDNLRRLTLRTPLARERREPRKEGGGLKYIRTRLEEAAPGMWALYSCEVDDTWETQIEFLN